MMNSLVFMPPYSSLMVALNTFHARLFNLFQFFHIVFYQSHVHDVYVFTPGKKLNLKSENLLSLFLENLEKLLLQI